MTASTHESATQRRVPVIVALQDQVSGVSSWALRLRDAFAGHPRYLVQLLLFGPDHAPDERRFDLHAATESDVERILRAAAPAIVVPNWLYFMYPICARLIAAGRSLRLIGFCRADDDEQYYNPLHWCAPLVSQFVAVSPECRQKLAHRIPDRAPDISCLPTGVHVPDSLQRTYSTQPIRLVYGGRVTQLQKRVMDFVPLVEALGARRVDYRFDIYGDGDRLAALREAMNASPQRDRVCIHGRRPPQAMPAIWAEHDVFIQTSDFEGTSNSMLESMAQGAVPVVTRTESGIDDIVRDRENGFIVPVGDMAAMAERIAELAAFPDRLETFGKRAYEVARGYSMDNYCDRFTEILNAVSSGPVRHWPADRPWLPEGGVYQYNPQSSESDPTPSATQPVNPTRSPMKSLARRGARALLARTGLARPLRRYLPGLLDLHVVDPRAPWEWFRKLTPDQQNEFCFSAMKHCLGDQRYLLYGWPVQQQYARIIADRMPGRSGLRILELGPGDNLMTAALWMLDSRVATLTMLDRFKGAFIDSAAFHRNLHEFARVVSAAQRDGFYNYYPFDKPQIERMTSAIRCQNGKVELDPEVLRYILLNDFAKFPFEDSMFDFSYSHATLEHLTSPGETIAELYRVLAPGAVTAHQIDLRDHRYFDSDPYRFLEVPTTEWNFGELAYPVNQWRANQYRDAFRSAGFEMLDECKVLRAPEKANAVRFAPEFESIPREDLLVTQAVFVLRKPEA